MKIFELDGRRTLILPGNHDETIKYAVEHWVKCANQAIQERGSFLVALSGGSTPKKIFQELSTNYKKSVDWKKVYLFWSDERPVPPDTSESNYHMAMTEAGLSTLPIPIHHIYRMVAELDIEQNAAAYEAKIRELVKEAQFDLVMLGMGDDGHTASLFPNTDALKEREKLVIANYVTQKNCWRMTFTYTCINQARAICLYVLGASKAEILQKVLLSTLDTTTYPSQNVGTQDHKATWIIDDAASKNILVNLG